MIDQSTINRILDTANIVDVVSEFVTLRKRGVNYVGLCPFHSDKSPSFYVSPAKNICKCFACGEGGTAVHFIMKHEQLNYFDALRWLAKKYNIEIQERELTDQEKQARNDRESMLIVNSWAQSYFISLLHNHQEGRSIGMRYFAERGLREDVIRKFQLGYSLEQRDALYKTAIQAGYQKNFLEKTGLIITYDNGNVNDRFRGRVIFPVHTLSGKVVAFGGRTLKKDDKTAKYVNSPESEIYHKSNELYGIYFAKQAIVRQDRCFLVEGYMDVIGMHQVGVENVVASSGTALTQGQIRLIHRFTNNITVLYDGDAAGIKAALRGIDLLLEEGMNIKVVLLPAGEDPDSFARSHGASEFNAYIQEHETDFIRFKAHLLLDEAENDPIKRSELIGDILRSIAIIPDPISRSIYIRECSTMMEIDEQILLNEINKLQQKKREVKSNYQTTQPANTTPPPVISTMPYPEMLNMPPITEEEATAAPMQEMPPMQEPYPIEEDLPPVQQVAAPVIAAQAKPARSPYEAYELALLHYVVRYGEQILFSFEEEDKTVTTYVARFIQEDLKSDNLTFYTPIFKQMLDEAAQQCGQPDFIAQRYFLAHPDANISRIAADLISDKYHLSKYHTKYRQLEEEKDKLDLLVPRDIYAFKEAYTIQQFKEIQSKIKELQKEGNLEGTLELMKELSRLNEIKAVLSKELGERIVLKM